MNNPAASTAWKTALVEIPSPVVAQNLDPMTPSIRNKVRKRRPNILCILRKVTPLILFSALPITVNMVKLAPRPARRKIDPKMSLIVKYDITVSLSSRLYSSAPISQ